jgi:hypothetical protein
MGVDFCGPKGYYSFGPRKGGIDMAVKIGRPTENPKGKSIHVRLDSESERILDKYTSKKNVTKAEAIRQGIKKLSDE